MTTNPPVQPNGVNLAKASVRAVWSAGGVGFDIVMDTAMNFLTRTHFPNGKLQSQMTNTSAAPKRPLAITKFLDRFDLEERENNHTQQHYAVAEARNLRFTISARRITDRHIDGLEI